VLSELLLCFQAAQESPLDKALREAEASRPAAARDLAAVQAGPARLRLMDLSLDGLFAAGGSNQDDEELENLQGGGHDPRKRGFTVQNVELSAIGAVDPYFRAEAHLIYFIDPIEGGSRFELEEAFAVTSSLPAGLQVKAGHYFTEFGRLNAQHPHQWDFLDQPVILTRCLGPDGLRSPGFRVAWLMPLPFYSEFIAGVQNANGETAASFYASDEYFEERPVGNRAYTEPGVRNLGDLLHSLRWSVSADLGDETTAVLGASGLFGPNATGEAGRTRLYGLDLRLKWRPAQNERGWPFVIWQTEAVLRDYKAAAQDFDPDGVAGSGDEFTADSDTLLDTGLYTQLVWGFMKDWAVGGRFEWVRGSRGSIDPATGAEATEDDAFRDRRTRWSAMLAWHPTEFSRLRLQYNFDVAEHLEETDEPRSHGVWLGLEILMGAHPAHTD
jgi:hypothetical protein